MSYGLRDMDGSRVELCDECGFDGRQVRDVGDALAQTYASLGQLSTHVDAGRRPEPVTWSGTEYVRHCVDVAAQLLELAASAAERPSAHPVETLVQVAAATDVLVRELTEDQWSAVTDAWPFEVSVRGVVWHLLHDLEHHVWDIRRGYAKLALADGVEVVTNR